jgi:hypothetical protein
VGRSEAADGIAGVAVDGTQFRVTLRSGQVLDSMALIGAVLTVDLRGGAARRVRIVDVRKDPDDPDGEVFLHSMMAADASGHWTALCKPDPAGAAWSFPLRGQWDSEGRRTSEHGFTLTCASGAIGKCVRFGYKPWRTGAGGAALADYHAACVKAVRADYCGGHGTTRDDRYLRRTGDPAPRHHAPGRGASIRGGVLAVGRGLRRAHPRPGARHARNVGGELSAA